MKIKEMRKRIQLTQADLAKELGTTQQTIARWESGKTEMTVSQLKAMAVALSCSVSELLGKKITAEEWKESPFAILDVEMPYGTLRLSINDTVRDYPIDEQAMSHLLSSISAMGVIRSDENSRPWLAARTLDNRILFINPSCVWNLELIGDDNEEMPSFEHPEVYAALENWGLEEVDETIAEKCKILIEEMEDDEAEGNQRDLRVMLRDGSERRCFLDDTASSELFSLELNLSDVPKNSFLMLEREDRYQSWHVNLSQVALIEVPANRYLRLNAPE